MSFDKGADMVKTLGKVQNLFNSHIKNLREETKISAAALAEVLGIHRNTQVNYEISRDPGIEYLLKFSDKLNISFWQLLYLRVKYSDCRQEIIDRALGALPTFGQIEALNHTIESELANDKIATQAETDKINATEFKPINSKAEQIASLFHGQEHIRLFKQQGQSMAPKICENDLIVVDTNDKKVIDGHIYCLELNQQIIARRLQIAPNKQIVICSENNQYTPISLNLNQQYHMTILGKITCYIGNHH